MSSHIRPLLTITLATLSVFLLEGCFGPFAKKKSKSGGGGGGSTTEETAAGGGAGGSGGGGAGGSGGGGGAGNGGVVTRSTDEVGCLQGVVIDGFTGQRIDISGAQAPNGIYVLIRGEKLLAKTVPNDPNQVGAYYICDIPVEETYPVYAFVPGYLPFESSVQIDSTRPVRVMGDQAINAEVKIPDPLEITNFKLFPLDNSGRDLQITVIYNGQPVQGAFVDIEPQAGDGHWAWAGDFANSGNTVLLPLREETSAEGIATFPAAKLSLGVRYRVAVTPATDSDLSSLVIGGGSEFTFGINGSAFAEDKNTYEKTVVVTAINNEVQVVSCSKEFQDFSSNGSITWVFNRPVMIVNQNGMTAALSGDVGFQAILQANDPADVDSEHVVASGSGTRKITLAPNWTNGTLPKTPNATKPSTDPDNVDRNLVITYALNGVFIKVAGDPNSNYIPLSTILAQADTPTACTTGGIRFFAQLF